jgi:hypothetical protein
MAFSWIQPSFAGGEIGPSLYGRIDMSKYQVALRKCDNFIVRQYGGVENRPGTRFVGEAKYPTRKCRLIPFQFSTVQTYALEFGHNYMRVIKDGAYVLNSSNVIYELAMPYAEADLFRIKFTQSADVLTLVHPAYPPKELRRYAHDNWQIVDVSTKNGPFEDINVDESVKVYASASTGTITLTAQVPLEFVTIRTELAAVTVTYQVITKVFMLEACYHAFWVDHVSSVLTPRHKPDRGVGRTATTGTEYVFCACSFAGAQRIETRRQAHESFRLGIGVAVDGVAGDFVVEALQLAHVFGNTERCGIVGTVCQSLINEAQVVQHTGGVGHWYGLGFGWLNALVIAAPYRFRNTCADGGFVLRAVVTRHIDRIGQDVVGFRQLLHDARDSPVLVSTIVDVKQRWQSLTD